MSNVINENNISGGIVRGKGEISGSVSQENNVNGGNVTRNQGGTYDYDVLVNKPVLNGKELAGEVELTYEDVGAVGAENELAIDEIDRMFATVFGE